MDKTFHIDGDFLQEDARMIKPYYKDYDNGIDYNNAMIGYSAHIASLARYPLAPGMEWQKKTGIKEAEFEVGMCNCAIGQNCPFVAEKWFTTCKVAVPLYRPVAEERILCAAIWYKELPLVNAEVLEGRGFKPYNTDRGAVVCGWRHANCILLKSALTGLKDSECGEHEQGFLTDKNRFVSREEAAKIALVSGQITKEIKTLFSEDLY